MARLIKRYGNRKLYDTQSSRYVTLEGVAELVRAGEDVQVVDNETGEDLTAVTFAQIIFEEQKKPRPFLKLPVLRWLIQQSGEALQELRSSVERGREAIEEFAQRGVRQLTSRSKGGRARLGEAWFEGPQRQLEQLQQRIDQQVRESIHKLTAQPAVQKELERVERGLRAIEKQIHALLEKQADHSGRRRRERPPRKKAR
jgi:polyhydroxyalkanoate synthesis repressor PhaR